MKKTQTTIKVTVLAAAMSMSIIPAAPAMAAEPVQTPERTAHDPLLQVPLNKMDSDPENEELDNLDDDDLDNEPALFGASHGHFNEDDDDDDGDDDDGDDDDGDDDGDDDDGDDDRCV